MADTPAREADSSDGAGDVPEASEIEQATAWLEKITRDPMADAVAGRARVVSAPEPVGRARYQECDVELVVDGPGIPATTVRMAVVFPRRIWPSVGDVLPARISASDPGTVEVNWEPLRQR